ncbi:MAG: GNAT family N-acetyltransferase [Bdellovibrionota bacterium]
MSASPLELQSARVRVWLPSSGEATNVLEYFKENRQFHAATSPFFPEVFYTEEFWIGRLETSREEFDRDQSVRAFIALTSDPDKVIGSMSLSQIVRGPFQACYLGYSLAKTAEGKGLMSESLALLIGYAFETMRLHRIMANYLPENERSGKVLTGLGFHTDGLSREYLFIDGKWRDHVMTSLTNQNWQPRESDRELF